MNKHIIVTAVLSTSLLVGCGGTKSCNDSTTKDIVLSIINEQLSKAAWGRDILNNGHLTEVDIESVKTVSRDNETDTYQCEATFVYKYKGNDDQYGISYRTSWLEDKSDTEVTLYHVDDIKSRILARALTTR